MDERFMQKMDDIREQCGFALIVSSAYRCPLYNDRVSATGKSGPHTTGRAMDIAVSHENAFIFLNAALENGITGIGIQQKGKIRFIHVDDLTNPYPRPRVWSY
jgi:uncharacterized protein YcbK (DUF882 family)